jgi:hypothetical protein
MQEIGTQQSRHQEEKEQSGQKKRYISIDSQETMVD